MTDAGKYVFDAQDLVASRSTETPVELEIVDPEKPEEGEIPDIDTSLKYDISFLSGEYCKDDWGSYTSANYKCSTNVAVCSRYDYEHSLNNSSFYLSDGDHAQIETFFASTDEQNIILLPGYLKDSTPEYGYTAVALKVTGYPDSEHEGCILMEVMAHSIASVIGQGGENAPDGKAWYDPSDGSITIEDESDSQLSWGNFTFQMHRKFSPLEPVEIALSKTEVSVAATKSTRVSITDGNGGYSAGSSDPSVATASIDGTAVVISGVAEGSATVTVSDSKGKTASISVTVLPEPSPGSGYTEIATDVTYSLTLYEGDNYKSSSFAGDEITGVYFCSRADFNAGTDNAQSVINGKDKIGKYYFDAFTDDDLIMIGGYVGSDGTVNYAYRAIVLQLTGDDATGDWAGCKVVTVWGVPCGNNVTGFSWFWGDGYRTAQTEGYFDPSDGSITIPGKVCGSHGSTTYTLNRKYSRDN